MSLLQAAKQALEALHNTQNALLFVSGSVEQYSLSNMTADAHDDADKAITALRQAIAQAEQQEPDYFGLTHDHTWLSIDKKQYDKLKPERRMACYTAPPQPVSQEPVAWAESDGEGGICWTYDNCFSDDPTWHENPVALYTAPPQREWVEPSDEQIEEAWTSKRNTHNWHQCVRAVLKLAKELNT